MVRRALRAAGTLAEPRSIRAVGGGCIGESLQVECQSGERFFFKTTPGPGSAAIEAEGLGALAGVSPLRVPRVVAAAPEGETEQWLLLEWVDRGRTDGTFAERLGEGLAELHVAGAARVQLAGGTFGWPRENLIGSLPQSNRPHADWWSFWVEQRLRPQIERMAPPSGDPGARDVWDRLCAAVRSGAWTRHDIAPALLHGDLWSGNVFPDERGTPVLVDPAVYVGDGRVDLAMMRLFGGFADAAFESYRRVRGPSGAESPELVELYQLYPLLVHANLFGGHYVGAALASAQRLADTV